jgi:hypothetical protein
MFVLVYSSSSLVTISPMLYSRGSQTVVRPLGDTVSPLGRGRVDCTRDISILNEIWVLGKIYILVGSSFDEIFHLTLSTGTAYEL